MPVLFPGLIVRVTFYLGSFNVCSRITGVLMFVLDCHAVTNWVCGHEKARVPARFLASHVVAENKSRSLFTCNP